jgi:hypothetical protein
MNTLKGLYLFGTVATLSLLPCKAASAGAGSIDTSGVTYENAANPTTMVNTESTSGIAPSIASITSPSINQQADFIQNNGSGFSGLTYPNCQGLCIFAISKINSRQNWEAVGGVVWQVSSPENTQAETNRLIVQAQREKLEQEDTITLVEKLSEAIEKKKIERANFLAIILAKKLGYSSFEQLLKDGKG